MKGLRLLYVLICIWIIFSLAVGVTFGYMLFNRPRYENNYELYGPLYGKDYSGHVGDGKYRMSHFNDRDFLSVKCTRISESGEVWTSSEYIFRDGYNWWFDYYGNLYYYAKDGYAVIYAENNLCKVFLTNQDAGKVEEENLIYLDSFDEFTKEEQARLKKLG